MNLDPLRNRWQRIPKKRRRWLVWIAGTFVVYVLFGFFAAPAIIKSQLVKRLPDITKRQAAVRQVKFNPLALSLTIRGLALTEPDGQRFAGWEEFYRATENRAPRAAKASR